MGKRDLWFKHSDGSFVLVDANVTENHVTKHIKRFVHELNPRYHIYYFNIYGDNPRIYDCGSHVEFFYWGDIKSEDP